MLQIIGGSPQPWLQSNFTQGLASIYKVDSLDKWDWIVDD